MKCTEFSNFLKSENGEEPAIVANMEKYKYKM
jgi:hypothetical protein